MPEAFAAYLAETTIASAVATAIGTTVTTAATLMSYTTFLVASASYGQYQQRRAARSARNAYNASLQDRQVMIRSAIEARRVVYGRAMVGGVVPYAQSTGDKSEYLHLILVLAGHEIDAVEEIWFNDVKLPDPDGSGYITSGSFSKTTAGQQTESWSATSYTLAQTPTDIIAVSRTRGTGDAGDTWLLTLGVDYTVAGSGITIVAGHVAGDVYFVNYTTEAGAPRVRIRKFLGGAGQAADSELVSASGGKWTSAHVGTGVAYLSIRLEYDQEVFGQTGVPEIRAVIRGKKVRDPRSGLTVWSENSALCAADYLRDSALGLACTAGEVPDADVTAAANICDETVGLYNAGTVAVTNGSATITGTGTAWRANVRIGQFFVGPSGVQHMVLSVNSDTSILLSSNYTGATLSGQTYYIGQKRYTTNGVLGTDAPVLDNLAMLLDPMAGAAVWVQGRWLLRAGAYRTPEASALTEDWLADGAVQIVPRASRAELFNAVTGIYIDPSRQHAEVQFPAVENATYRTQDGGRRVPRDIPMPMVNDPVRAQRIGKIALERARQALVLRVQCNLKAYNVAPTDVLNVTLSRYGFSSKAFEVLQREWDPSGGITLTMRETAAGVFAWNYGEATAFDLAPNTVLPDPNTPPPALTGVTVASGTAHLQRLGDGTIVTRGLVQWTQADDVFVVQGGQIEAQWKLDSAGTWQSAPSVPGSSTSLYIGPLDDSNITLVRVRPVNSLGRAGEWTYVTHVVAGKTAAPSNVTNLTNTIKPPQVIIKWDPCTDLDYSVTELRSGASWAAGSFVWAGAGAEYQHARPPNGAYVIWAAHKDTSGNYSATPVSTSFTVDNSIDSAGTSTYTLDIFYTGASAPGTPTSTTATYTFTTNAFAVGNLTAGWTRAMPAASGTNGIWVSSYTFQTTTPATPVAAGVWSAPVLVAQLGAAGLDGISIAFDNSAHPLPSNADGTVTSYTGSGGTIKVYEGGTALTYHTVGAAGRFTIGTPTVSPGGAITVGSISGSGTTTATIAVHSGASAAQDVISITYPITVHRAGGGTATTQVVQSLTKSKTGAVGATGANSAVVILYQRTQTNVAPGSLPSGTFTYTFADGSLSGGTLNGWGTSIPSTGGEYLWVTRVPVSANTATVNISSGWSTAALLNNTRKAVRGFSSQYDIRYGAWDATGVDYANRVVMNILTGATTKTGLASTTHLVLGDAVTITNASPWIKTRGIYAGGTTYEPGDLAVNSGLTIAYRCIKQSTGNVLTNTTYWSVYRPTIVSKTWAANTVFNADDVVSGLMIDGVTTTYWLASFTHTSPVGSTWATERDGDGFAEERYWDGSATWIRAGQVIDGNLLVKGSVNAETLAATAIDGKVITGSTVRTAATGARVEFNATSGPDAIKGYNSAGTQTMRLSTDTPQLSLYQALSTPNNHTVLSVENNSLTYGIAISAGLGALTSGSNGVAVYANVDYASQTALKGVANHADGYAVHATGQSYFAGLIYCNNTIQATRFISSVGIGTAPLSVTSTTKVTNLNADLLDGNDWTAPGPIGGTTPSSGAFTSITVTSTTKVTNLNADRLDDKEAADFAQQASGTPIVFSTLDAAGAATATFSNTTKPGSASNTNTWIKLTINGTLYTFPVWQCN